MTPAPTHTDEQRAALAARDTPVALGAGAGCGKTFILTERFLSHLRPADAGEPPAELGELVAITFTEAAAREMRERLRAKCRDRLAESGTPDDARFWRRLVRGLDSARVSTIHSFCGKL
ncbi:MAG: UvrD-helicase domain-containing protein, partial [Planctomycetota bacterium]